MKIPRQVMMGELIATLRQHNLSLVVFKHHLGLDRRMQIGLARRTLERIRDEAVESVFFVEHIMTPLMTSLPRLPYGRRTQV